MQQVQPDRREQQAPPGRLDNKANLGRLVQLGQQGLKVFRGKLGRPGLSDLLALRDRRAFKAKLDRLAQLGQQVLQEIKEFLASELRSLVLMPHTKPWSLRTQQEPQVTGIW